jgi:hypothetical protein
MKTRPTSTFSSLPASLSAALAILCLLLLIRSGGQLQAQVSKQMPTFPKDKNVTEMTTDELLSYYSSELRHVDFSKNQDQLDSLLAKIGERVQAFFRDFSNTSSNEFVLMQRLNYNGGIEKQNSRKFNYLSIYHPNGTKPSLEEYRTDKNFKAVSQDAITGFYITAGYACISLNFHPGYQQGLRFRYLGQQTSYPRAHIIAFAQKPDTKELLIQFTDVGSRNAVGVPVQGIAWVDPRTFQILQLRVNLLAAGNHSPLTGQTTEIKFSEVRFGETQKQLWLPNEVIVTTQISNRTFRNLHRYSDYKLFAVNSDSKIEKPKARE